MKRTVKKLIHKNSIKVSPMGLSMLITVSNTDRPSLIPVRLKVSFMIETRMNGGKLEKRKQHNNMYNVERYDP